MKKIISLLTAVSMLLTVLPCVYADNSFGTYEAETLYNIDETNKIISGIPLGSTVEEVCATISDDGKVTDIDGNDKDSDAVVEDGDRFVSDGNEYYLKTYATGLVYSDNFNYRDYDEYKTVINALNTSANANKFMRGTKADVLFDDYDGNRAMKMIPRGVGNATYEMNFVGFDAQSGTIIVEYDIAQTGLNKKSIWAYVSGLYTGVTDPTTGVGYALWGSKFADRGTLMRNSENKARWISADGNSQLLMNEEHGMYHVVQVLNFSGNIETYIDGTQARIANEQITEDVDKSMSGFGGMRSIGLGIYSEASVDYDQIDDASIVWDNVKVYNPLKYAEYFICRLPEIGEDGDAFVLTRIDEARDVVDRLTDLGIDTTKISNIDTLEYWESMIGDVVIESDYYTIDGDNHTITGVVAGESVDSFVSHLSIPKNCNYDFTLAASGIITSGDKLIVSNIFGAESEFTFIADKDFIISEYIVSGNTVSQIPYGTPVNEFMKNIITAENVQCGVFTGQSENNDIVLDGDILRIGNEEYTLSVIPASDDNSITSSVYNVDSENNIISDIPYNTSFEAFKAAIELPEFATVTYPYEDSYEGTLQDGDELTVIAQNGDKRKYALNVNQGNPESKLTIVSGSGLTVDEEKKTVANVERGISVSELLGLLSATNDGQIKIFTKDQTEKVSGTINGMETIRLYPQDPTPGDECDIYTISCKSEEIAIQDLIVTVDDAGFKGENGGAVSTSGSSWIGYNNLVTRYVTGGPAVFNFTVPEAGDYKMYLYLSCQALTQTGKLNVIVNGEEIASESVDVQQKPEGWYLLSTSTMQEGDEVKITSTTTSGYMRMSAARMTMSKMVTLNAKAINGDAETGLTEGENEISKENLSFEFETRADIKKDDISIVSENGNNIDFDFSSSNGKYTVTPKVTLSDYTSYYLTLMSEVVSKPYVYVLKGQQTQIDANTSIVFYTSSDKKATSAENAVKAKVNIKVAVNKAYDGEKAKAIICYYPTGGIMETMKEVEIDMSETKTHSISEDIEINTNSQTGSIKVFIWSSDLIPITDLYYK